MITHRKSWWEKKISDWESSSMTQGQFCKENGISVSKFLRWRKRINISKKLVDKKNILDTTEGDIRDQFVEVDV